MTASVDVPAEAVRVLGSAGTVAVLTGAGMSAESGVPTFRSVSTGLWARYDPMTLATPQAFAEQPAHVWGWYLHRAQLVRSARPHAGHRSLAALAANRATTVVTQNVDDLHERGGSSGVLHLHGSLLAFRCSECARPWSGDVPLDLAAGDAEIAEPVVPPECGVCLAPVRPGIVWFGEQLPSDTLERAMLATSTADVTIVVGTSAQVYPAAGLPELTRAAGGAVIEINPERTPLSEEATVSWRATAGLGLPALVDAVVGARS